MLQLLYNVLIPSLIASVGWGVGPLLDRKSLKILENDYETLFVLKMFLAGIFAIIFYFATKKNINLSDDKIKNSFKYIIISAFLLSIIGHYFYYKAMSKTKYTTLVVLVSYVIPLLIVGFLSTILLNEKMNRGMLIGMFICLIGISIFVYNSNI